MAIMDAPAELVERRFAAGLGRPVRLTDRRLAGEGLSDETGLLTFEDLTVVVRLFRAGAVARHEVRPDRLHRLLTVVHAAGLPVPRPLWFDPSPELFGGPYSVVAKVAGEAVVPWSPAGRKFLAEAGAGPIGEQFCRILAEIHAMDTAGLDFLDMPQEFATERVNALGEYLNRVRGGPEPILVDGLGWLRANLPWSTTVTLLHGDYRAGNMLFDGDQVTAVLDWEFAALGDPVYDLGWVCCPSNRVNTDLVCMLLPEADFLARYERYRGREVDRDALAFWVVYHQVRHAIMWLEAGRNFELGTTDDLRLARMHSAMPTMRKMVADLLGAR